MCALHPKSRSAGHPRRLARGASQLLGGVLGSRVVHEGASAQLDPRQVLEAVGAPVRRGETRKKGGRRAGAGLGGGPGGRPVAKGGGDAEGGARGPGGAEKTPPRAPPPPPPGRGD